MRTKSIEKTYNWYEDKETIQSEILTMDDVAIIDSYGEKYDHVFITKLDVLQNFIDEVCAVERQTESLIRAFWIVNIVYMSYYKKPRIKTLHSFYQIRHALMQKQKLHKKASTNH